MGDYVTEENTKVKLEDDVLTPELQKEELQNLYHRGIQDCFQHPDTHSTMKSQQVPFLQAFLLSTSLMEQQ